MKQQAISNSFQSLRKILTTVSIIALASGEASGAAVTAISNDDPAPTANVDKWVDGHAPVAGDSIQFGLNGNIQLDTAGVAYNDLILDGFGGGLEITGAGNFSFNNITHTIVGEIVDIKYSAASGLSIGDGGDGAINSVDFNGYDGSFAIGKGNIVTIDNSVAGAAGNLIVQGTVTVQNEIGGTNSLSQITLNDGAKLTAANGANATTLTFAEAGGQFDIQGSVFTGDVDFESSGKLMLGDGGTIAGGIGGNGESTIEVLAGTAHLQGDTEISYLALDTNSIDIAAAATLNVRTGTTGTGSINTLGASTLIGNFGAPLNKLTSITLAGATTLGGGGNGTTIIADDFDGSRNVTVSVNSSIQATSIDNKFIINKGVALTLNGGTLSAASVINGPGSLSIMGEVTAGAAIGGVTSLALISFEPGAKLIAGANIKATTISFSDNMSNFSLGDYTFTGNIDFNGNDSTIEINDGEITGSIDNTSEVAAGTLVLTGVTSNSKAIGASNPIALIQIGADGEFTAGADIAASSLQFAGAGKVDLQQRIFTGDVDFNNQDASLSIDGGTVVGNIDSTTGSNGTLVISDEVSIQGSIGETNALKLIKIQATGSLTAGGDIAATTLQFQANGGQADIGDYTFTGNVDFNSMNGVVIVNGGDIDGDIDSIAGPNGTLIINGTTNITGTIGLTSALTAIQIGAGGKLLTDGHDIKATILQFQADGGEVSLIGNSFRGNIDFKNTSSILSANNVTIHGDIDSIAGPNGTLKLDGGNVTLIGAFGATNAVAVDFVGDYTLEIQGDTINTVNVTPNSSGEGLLKLTHVGDINFSGNIGSEELPIRSFWWADEQKLTLGDSTIYVNALDSLANADVANNKLVIDGDVTLGVTDAGDTNGIRIIVNDTKTLTLKSGTFDAKVLINGEDNNQGVLVIDGAVTTNGLVGGTKTLAALNVTATGALTAGADIEATTLKFLANGGKVDLTSKTFTGAVNFDSKAGTITISAADGQITGDITNAEIGVIHFTDDGTIDGNIAGNGLGLLRVDEGKTATLSGAHLQNWFNAG